MRERQLAFALPLRPALGREDFLVAPCNAAAVAWLDRWPDWPAPVLCLYGAAGCGKSHLVQVWRARSAAAFVTPAALADEGPAALARSSALAADDADRLDDERALLHLVNLLRERGGHALLTAATPPSRWPLRLPDLRSRLTAAPAVGVGLPDDQLLAAVLVKLFADRQLRVGADVISFVAARIERSFAAARGAVDRLDQAALAAGRRITVPFARRVLAEG